MKFFTGAPASGSLKWNPGELLDELLPPFLRFIDGTPVKDSSFSEPSSASWPSWRSVGTVHMHNDEPATTLHYGGATLSQPSAAEANGEHLSSAISYEGDENLENSFAVHEFFEPNQLTSITLSATDPSLFENSNFESFGDVQGTDYSVLSNTEDSILERQMFPTNENIADLSALPNANYLRRILPGTMTVDIIVGVIDISPSRTVTVRRYGRPYEMDVVDLYVRDETKSGLKISIWLKPEAHASSRPSARRQVGLRPFVSRLRRGDAVFFKHIALRTYQGEVCGQSLSGERYPNTGTKIALLARSSGSQCGDEGQSKLDCLSDAHRTKLERVQQWLKQYLNVGSKPDRALGKRKLHTEELPADTQSE